MHMVKKENQIRSAKDFEVAHGIEDIGRDCLGMGLAYVAQRIRNILSR